MNTQTFSSWGRVLSVEQQVCALSQRHAGLPTLAGGASMLPRGNGRSYGDSNLNPGGALLLARGMDRFVDFDPATGLLTCEAGVLLSEITELVLPQGWFLQVTPGTQFVTVGGAIANDVHGKNHHAVGNFSHHLTCLELLRSDGSRRLCSRTENPEWFAATVGGLGLTGLITWAQLQLRRVHNPFVLSESLRFRHLEDFFELSQASADTHEYTVAWIDCTATGRQLGRGIFNRANHAPALVGVAAEGLKPASTERSSPRRMPFTPPVSLVNGLSLKAFNLAYFHRQRQDHVQGLQHYRPFFYPLDALLEWNRMYGPRGFYQYQCVIPPERALAATRQLLQAISRSGMGSFLAVLKQFGAPASLGMLSFPMPGTTLALDFPNRGPAVHRLFAELDRIVLDSGGRLYPAKDGLMGPSVFQAGYPRWQEFTHYIDPRFASGFWRRVTETA